MRSSVRPGLLLVLDGWGLGPPGAGNAIATAAAPTLRELEARCQARLDASGTAVGLPSGVVGNSEIGHLVIGAGRPLEYDSLLVQRAADDGTLRTNSALVDVCRELAARAGALHIVGLCSDGRIHSDVSHVGELLHAAASSGLLDVRLHPITDGRDVADGTAAEHLSRLRELTAAAGVGRIVSVVGRNFAMDKSGDGAPTEAAARLVLDGVARGSAAAPEDGAPAPGRTGDGWVAPTVIDGEPSGVRPGDALLFANFRSDRTAPLVDRMAEILAASDRGGVRLLSLAQYDTRGPVPALVTRADASGGIADVLEAAGVRSVRVAEREKFDHVTFFFNGRDPRARPLEEHLLVPTEAGDDPAGRPAMNVEGVADEVIGAAGRDDVGLVVANLANIDVVGHTGSLDSTVAATEAVDRALTRIRREAEQLGRWVLVVGDHGNGEQMLRPAGAGDVRPYGGHTDSRVPCAVLGPGIEPGDAGTEATLPAVAPTVLSLLGVDVPGTMLAPVPLSAMAVP